MRTGNFQRERLVRLRADESYRSIYMKRKFQLNLNRLALVVAGNIFFAGQGYADSWQNVLSAGLATEYDSNPAMTAVSAGSVTRILLTPGYALIGSFEQDEIRAGLAYEIERSSNQTLNPGRENPTVSLDWLHRYESGNFGLASRYTEFSTRETANIATVTNLVGTTKTRYVSGTWSNKLTERSTLGIEGSYLNVTFNGGTNTDYLTRNASVRYDYEWSENNIPFVRLSTVKYEPAGGVASSTLSSVMLGSNWKTESLNWLLQLGRSRDSAGQNNTLASAKAEYSGQQTKLTLTAEHLVLPTGQGGFSTVNQAGLGFSYALSDYTSTGFDLSDSRSSAVTTTGSGATEGVWLEHNLDPSWGLRTYLHRRSNSQNGGATASANTIGIALNYSGL